MLQRVNYTVNRLLSSQQRGRIVPPNIRTSVHFSSRMSSEAQNSAQQTQGVQPNLTSSPFASAREERKWNNLSEKMSAFHEYFKQEFNTLYELADGSFTGRGLSLSRYLDTARAMNHHLTMHHTIEERHLFPLLGKTMPQFAAKDNGAHLASHHGIHEGLDRLDALVKKWKSAPSEYSPEEMRACLDSFRDVLFRHLDEEVADLRGENLKKYITLEVLESFPI